jgi:deoxyribodipyrimidine photo-lyase
MHLVWHRADLRTHDNPALLAAAEGAAAGLVVLDPNILENTSARRRAWFFQNVRALQESYEKLGSRLLVAAGLPWEVVPKAVADLGIQKVFAIENSTPYARYRDQKTEAALAGPITWFSGQYIQEPGEIRKPDGTAYTVFTPYSKRWWAKPTQVMSTPYLKPLSAAVSPSYEHPLPDDKPGIPLPEAGEEAALKALEGFISNKLLHYHQNRDGLAGDGVSKLSYYFTLGILSPRLAAQQALKVGGEGAKKWVNELCWRDFSGDLLYHNPSMLTQPIDPRWKAMDWIDDAEVFEAWLEGHTGIPVVDACMRELRETGFMSNRGRMCVAQFAVKLALLPWQKCERAMRDLLIDGDNASNLQGWQWSGGLGVDAAPYFRVYNMVTQGQTHDPSGAWLRRWVPESGGNPQPYKKPILDLDQARQRYLARAEKIIKKQLV